MKNENIKHIAILGSTGSIGTQTLDIIEKHPDLYKVSVLTANHNWQLLAKQAIAFRPKMVVIADKSYYKELHEALNPYQIMVKAGAEEIAESVKLEEIDMVVTAMVGYSGLLPTINAIRARKKIALANKETLVVAGEIITKLVKEFETEILPVDSEHSAIFQCLVGEKRKALNKILLTASGGPFRKLTKNQLENVTVKDALNHPNWAMGAKVTIDSASMMNKGFEMIEARWLFDCSPNNIEILIHPQSIIHSMVEFSDGSVKAQLGVPDMHIPIQYALSYPDRLSSSEYHLDWKKVNQLTFEQPDFEKFPLLEYAFTAIEHGGNMPCVLNAANEVAVKAFLDEKIKFTQLPLLVEYVLSKAPHLPVDSLEVLMQTHADSTQLALGWVDTHC